MFIIIIYHHTKFSMPSSNSLAIIVKQNAKYGFDSIGGIKLLAPVDISTCAPWITQNEQHFVAS
jgi:hypothetical protein